MSLSAWNQELGFTYMLKKKKKEKEKHRPFDSNSMH